MVAAGVSHAVDKVVGAAADVEAAQVVLFVHLDHAEFLVEIGARGQEDAGGNYQNKLVNDLNILNCVGKIFPFSFF